MSQALWIAAMSRPHPNIEESCTEADRLACAQALPSRPSSVSDVLLLETTGPWSSKSGGSLRVPLSLPYAELAQLLDYDAGELEALGRDIRGLRVFDIEGAQMGGIAGNQFHRIRTEIIFPIGGALQWEFEDLHGTRRKLQAEDGYAVRIPPFILHRATFLTQGMGLVTIASTIFVREDPRTHDTYSRALFHSLQQLMRPVQDAG